MNIEIDLSDGEENDINFCNEFMQSISKKIEKLSDVSNFQKNLVNFNEQINQKREAVLSVNECNDNEGISSKSVEKEKLKCDLLSKKDLVIISCVDLRDSNQIENENSIDNEVVSPLNGLQLECKLCSFSTLMSTELNRHTLEKHLFKGKLFNCDYCPYKTLRRTKLREHLDNRHKEEHSIERKFKCEWTECHQSFIALSTLKLHKLTHSLVCEHCGKGFHSNQHFNRHIMIHDKNGLNKNENALKEKLKCNYCGTNFNWKKNLISHLKSKHYVLIRDHLKELPLNNDLKPLVCKFCGKIFAAPSKLRRHEDSHLGLKPFKCKINGCSYTAATKQHLMRHESSSSHKDGNNSWTKEYLNYINRSTDSEGKKFSCTWPECDYWSKSQTSIRWHFRNHIGKPVLKCQWNACQREYKDPKSYINHLKSHPSLAFICDDHNCGKTFESHSELSVHRKIHNKST